jgi:hypothetical protein
LKKAISQLPFLPQVNEIDASTQLAMNIVSIDEFTQLGQHQGPVFITQKKKDFDYL